MDDRDVTVVAAILMSGLMNGTKDYDFTMHAKRAVQATRALLGELRPPAAPQQP